METELVFGQHVNDYEAWFGRYPFVFQSEIEAVREMMPVGEKLIGIEVGVGTGRYSEALGIKQGIEPSVNMRTLANKRGIETMDAFAEALPYGDLRFDFVLMIFCPSYFADLHEAFKEAHRVLKEDGALVVGMIDKDSAIGKAYEAGKSTSTFYRTATFYATEKVVSELREAGFRHFEFRQTLFGPLDSIDSFQPSSVGHGEGSFVVIKALKHGLRA